MTPFVVGRCACQEHAQKLKINSLKSEEQQLILTLNKDGLGDITWGQGEHAHTLMSCILPHISFANKTPVKGVCFDVHWKNQSFLSLSFLFQRMQQLIGK